MPSESSTTPAISIIMPCYNRAHDLIRPLRAYDRQSGCPAFELIAVDDGSTDATYAVLQSYRAENYTLRIVRLEKNQGPAAARNRGIELAAAPLTLIVGDDILPDENFVRGHLTAHHRQPLQQDAFLGKVIWPPDFPVNTLMAHIDGIGAQQFSYHFMQDGREYDFRHFYTANISLKTDFLKSQPRWFDTDFRYAAYEDAELAYRLSKRGMRLHYAAPILGLHHHYHTIWTFSERQRKSGLMANVLLAKHPRLRFNRMFRFHYQRILNLVRSLPLTRKPNPESVQELEDIARRVASYYEWTPNDYLDRLYLAVLDYFYYDGFVSGMFENSPQKLNWRAAHAARYLVPTLTWFLQETGADQTERPFGEIQKQAEHIFNLVEWHSA